jgi:hypothetical protein
MSKQTNALRRALRQHRLDRRLSYAQLAKEIGDVSTVSVRDFVLGNTDPHETTEYAISQYLDRVKAVA